jgi:hypothetical protein
MQPMDKNLAKNVIQLGLHLGKVLIQGNNFDDQHFEKIADSLTNTQDGQPFTIEDILKNGSGFLQVSTQFGDKNGPMINYHSNGNVAGVKYYTRGHSDGPDEGYWEDGKLFFYCYYHEGKAYGPRYDNLDKIQITYRWCGETITRKQYLILINKIKREIVKIIGIPPLVDIILEYLNLSNRSEKALLEMFESKRAPIIPYNKQTDASHSKQIKQGNSQAQCTIM